MPSHTCGQNRLGERQRGGPEAWVLMPLSLTLQPSEALGHFLSTEDIIFFVFQEGQMVLEIHLIRPHHFTAS